MPQIVKQIYPNEPWTEGVNRLAQTIGMFLDAQNQRAMQENQMKLQQAQIERQKLGDIASVWETTADPRFKTPYYEQAQKIGLVPQESMGYGTTPQITTQPIQDTSTYEGILTRNLDKGLPYAAASKIAERELATKKPATPFQANNLYSMFAVQSKPKHGQDVTTPEGYRNFLQWAGTPEGIDEWKNFMQRQARGETFKEQYVGPSVDQPGMDVWTSYDSFGKGKTELRPSAGYALPRNIGSTPATELNRGIMLDTIVGNIERVKKNYNPSFVGPVAGRLATAKEATIGLPEEQSMFYADTRDIADMLLRARSGAQINEQEYNRLSKLVPTPNLPPSSFQARLKRFEEQLGQIMQAQKTRLQAGNYLAGKPSRAPQVQAAPKQGTRVGRFTVEEVQ
ncbi:MAG TPA: hypothetical protein VIY48_18520 [Candidatus Paceibacterota bacterium]